MRLLIASTHGAGHLTPLLPLATACAAGGHDILVAAPPPVADAVDAADLEFWPVGEPPPEQLRAFWSHVPGLPPEEANVVVTRELFAGMYVEATLPRHREACRTFRPDVVIRETSEFGSALAAELEDIAHARVGIGLAETEELSLQLAAPALDGQRAAAGLPPDPGAERLRRAPYLTWFPASLENPDVPAQPRTTRLRDPGWDATPEALPDWWPDRDGDAPLVYVTFGSVAGSFARAAPIFGVAMEALAALPIRALLTVGRSVDLDALPAAPPNVRVERWVPQQDVLAHVAAVVCHGGSGSTLGALAAGRPLVIVPLFADQPYNARRVAAAGAGLAVEPDPGAIRAALERVLDDERYRVAAERIRDEMRSLPAVDAFLADAAAVPARA